MRPVLSLKTLLCPFPRSACARPSAWLGRDTEEAIPVTPELPSKARRPGLAQPCGKRASAPGECDTGSRGLRKGLTRGAQPCSWGTFWGGACEEAGEEALGGKDTF